MLLSAHCPQHLMVIRDGRVLYQGRSGLDGGILFLVVLIIFIRNLRFFAAGAGFVKDGKPVGIQQLASDLPDDALFLVRDVLFIRG